MPRNDSNPSEWKSYIVTTVPTKNATTGAITPATRPSTDNTGTLEAVAGKPGTYKYTFYRDVPVKANGTMVVGRCRQPRNNRVEDLGDLTYDATLPHRLVIQIGGAAPGTGSNTPNGVTVTPTVNQPIRSTSSMTSSPAQRANPAQRFPRTS